MYSPPPNLIRNTQPATQLQPGNVPAAPQQLPGVPGPVAPGVAGVLAQTQQNQQHLLTVLPPSILDGLKKIREKQERVQTLRQEQARLEVELQRDTEDLLLQYHAIQQEETGRQQQQVGRLQQRNAGLESNLSQLQNEYGQLQSDNGLLMQREGALQAAYGQLLQQQGQQRQQQYPQSQQTPQRQQHSQPHLQPQQLVQQLPRQTQQPFQAQQPPQVHQPLQGQQPYQLQPPLQVQQQLHQPQQPTHVQQQPHLPPQLLQAQQHPHQLQQPLRRWQDSQMQQPSQPQQPTLSQLLQRPSVPPQQLAQQYAQQPQPRQPTQPRYAVQTYQVPLYSPQMPAQSQFTAHLPHWNPNTPDAYAQDAYEPYELEPESNAWSGQDGYTGEQYTQQGLSSGMSSEPLQQQSASISPGASKRARTGDTDDELSETGSRKRQKTAPSNVRPAWLKEALSRGPASAADAIFDLASYNNSGSSSGVLKRGITAQELFDHIRRVEGWVELVASRGGDATPVMIFGFDQLARKWNSANSVKLQNDAALTIPANMLRADTPASFRALWLAIKSKFHVRGDGVRAREATWMKFWNAVRHVRHAELVEARHAALPIPGQRDENATETIESTVTKFENELLGMPFDWGDSLERLGEHLPPARAVTGGTTTTTTTNTSTNNTNTNTNADADADADAGTGTGTGND